jgi:hypothetical protein
MALETTLFFTRTLIFGIDPRCFILPYLFHALPTMEEFDATVLASVQKSDYLDVHKRHSVEVQCYLPRIAF